MLLITSLIKSTFIIFSLAWVILILVAEYHIDKN